MTTPRLLSDRYELGETLGYGGMSEVHRGRDVRLGRDVAVKVLRADLARDPQFQERFRREAQNAAALNHPAIVAVYDTGETRLDTGPLPYIVMEYVDGRTLRDIVKTEGPLPGQRAMEIMADVCAALDFSHRHGIVHRDVKPANVMITRTGAVKVMDFGIARAVADGQAAVTQTAAVIGTAQYLSPEQARGEAVDARSDVYAAGCVLFELLTGEPPFTGDSPVAVAYQHVREDPKPPSALNPRVTPQLDAIVLKAMAKGQANRYQSAAEMRADLVRVLSGQRPSAPMVMTDADRTTIMGAGRAPETRVTGRHRPDALVDDYDDYDDYDEEEERRRRRRRAWLIALGVLLAVVIIGMVIWLMTSSSNQQAPGADTYKVPNLVGQTETAAQNQLAKDDIKYHTEYVACGATADNSPGACGPNDIGKVVSTDPAAGASMPKTQQVLLKIGKQPDAVPVPNVVGKSPEDATKQLTDAKLSAAPDVQETETNDPDKVGKVIAQSPSAGTQVKPGTPVTLTVGKAPEKVTVDDYTGQDYDAAAQNLQSAGLQATRQDVDSDKPKGTVVDQAPKAGTEVTPGTTITLMVSNGQANKITIDNMVGMTEQEARQHLAQLGFTGQIQIQKADTDDPTKIGQVDDQNPGPGEKVDKDGTVTLIVLQYRPGGGGGGGGGGG
ncbi:Stk1 family PASTA domain-containing Ser/Thr kinase [Labedaea rhizosphaerae]|uniref:non-specific serine/threonine protein kinase n=1 Tax=Labedaea rhizosphaerae TaxID=598644 RepID=A0A4R6SNY5_LABRH|nr:Stk1 family PASTA domain-containing Ser/Thr kinase [Labedaea rhizosphaerae]TDQ05142.1 serine/threonine-protein kinase [Labedaea rhizosphaerae]